MRFIDDFRNGFHRFARRFQRRKSYLSLEEARANATRCWFRMPRIFRQLYSENTNDHFRWRYNIFEVAAMKHNRLNKKRHGRHIHRHIKHRNRKHKGPRPFGHNYECTCRKHQADDTSRGFYKNRYNRLASQSIRKHIERLTKKLLYFRRHHHRTAHRTPPSKSYAKKYRGKTHRTSERKRRHDELCKSTASKLLKFINNDRQRCKDHLAKRQKRAHKKKYHGNGHKKYRKHYCDKEKSFLDPGKLPFREFAIQYRRNAPEISLHEAVQFAAHDWIQYHPTRLQVVQNLQIDTDTYDRII